MTKRVNDYNSAVSYILEIPRFSAKNDTEVTKDFLKHLNCEYSETIIHVAGTNGKGSVCAFLDSVHRCMGKKTGLFTSPHLVDIRERICIDGQMISKEEFLGCTNFILEKIESFNGDRGSYHPSFFEFIFFMAVKYFSDNKVEVGIYETGLGGRLDATNALPKKSVCVITEIGMDHMEYLGNTISEIAAEKAGIIMAGVPVVYSAGKEESARVIEDRAAKMHALALPVYEEDATILSFGKEKKIDFSYKYGYDSSAIFTVRTYAHYQKDNAALALRALQTLYTDEVILKDAVKEGIESMEWPGRMEEIEPNVFVDGGHNVDGLKAFTDTVRLDGCENGRYLLFSAVSDKQVELMSTILVGSGLFETIGICPIDNSRATGLDTLNTVVENSMRETGVKARLLRYESLKDAYFGMKSDLPEGTRLYICGSLYLVGAVKEILKG